MKFLVIAQDLRTSGTSEGIVSRSFIAKLRKSYPEAIIDVVYLKTYASEAHLHLLPVNSIEEHIVNIKIPLLTKWLNKFYWRLFHESLQNKYIQKCYANYISKLDYTAYDQVFIRSAGLDYEIILACKDLPILKKAIINFHDPYPLFWYPGGKQKLTTLELFKIKEMYDVVSQAKACISPSTLLSNDLAFLFGFRKKFYTIPHQYSAQVFDFSDNSHSLKKNKKTLISYQGALMFGRNIDVVLEAYFNLVKSNKVIQENSEFVIRIHGDGFVRLFEKYKDDENIKVLHCLNFSNSSYEQVNEASINIILENGPFYSNTLVGKAPFLAAIGKPILVIAPQLSELRQHVKDQQYIASYDNPQEVQQKLENLINTSLVSTETVAPFGDYFGDENFKIKLETIFTNK
ncbi:hypothetical protein [Flavobacterium sp.]|uniref:hypothetical protein n=1 Tax=Flavobacterium sp. TaxID=239 RepID=UPI000EF097FF|nr:hypothetical protein [Flavobacterium sp.]HCQ11990.1 hypothetical protein [Flavobacterium sp.]